MGVMRSIGVLLFPGFELLDVFGPLEMYGMAPEHFGIHLVAENPGQVASKQGPRSVVETGFETEQQFDILLVPGGQGTRDEVNNSTLLEWIRNQAANSEFVTSVCTGSALLATAGLLDGKRATTNKRAFSWVMSQGDKVEWLKQARWVKDEKFFTSSGVTAGMDMTLALIAGILGRETADRIATQTEYEWHSDASWDPFAKLNGLV